MFAKSDSHTYKVVVMWTSGKQTTFNYVESITLHNDAYVLVGQSQQDGTMERRSFALERRVVAFLDVRQISTTRQMPNRQAQNDSGFAPAGDDGEVAMF